MAEDDSSDGFEMICSQPEKLSYDVVPEDKLFKYKFLSLVPARKVRYMLKKGVSLPYTTSSGGIINFIMLSFPCFTLEKPNNTSISSLIISCRVRVNFLN